MTPVKTILVRKSCWGSPGALEKEVLRCVAAERDGTPLPGALAPYWRAFHSPFAPVPGTPFTLYSPYVDRVVLYVYEENCDTAGVSRELFFARCAKINERLGEIARTVLSLAGRNSVTLEFRGALHPPLPPDLSTHWRRFEHIMRDRREIIHVMSCDVLPGAGPRGPAA